MVLRSLIDEEAKRYKSTYSKYGTERFWSEPAHSGDISTQLDITITDDLLEEGIRNEVIRIVNNERKNVGLSISDRIRLSCPIEFRQSFLEDIKADCLCDYLSWFEEDYEYKFTLKIGTISVPLSLEVM